MIEHYHTIGHGEKGAFFAWLENEFGIKKSKFHRVRRDKEGKLKNTPRERDQRKREIVKLVMEMKERGKQRSDKAREMATERCLNRLVRKGIMEPDEISASHADYIARTEFGYREETPRVRWECDYALQEVQTDGSTSKFFRPYKHVITENGPDVLLRASGRPLSYRKDDPKEKVILWQFQDKYSRLRTVRAFPGKAESTAIMAAHMKFWLNREEDEHPMYHLPWELAHDNASMFKTEDYKTLAKALDFTYRESTPYEKTGIGSVENRWKTIWQWELEWSEDYPELYLSQYNMMLHEAMAAEQAQDHPYLTGTKGEIYQRSLLAQQPRPRVLEEDIFTLMQSTYIRKVNAELTVSTPETGKLKVPQYWYGIELIGQEVKVSMNWRGEYRAELVNVPDYAVNEARDPFEVVPFEHRSKGDYSGSPKKTYQQQLKESIKSGDSLYDAIMAGDVALNDEGEPFDLETGEIIEAPKPVTLQPQKEVHSPDSVFVDSEKEPEATHFESTYQARVWIGQQLKSVNLTYDHVSSHFDNRLVDFYELDRKRIKDAVELLKENLKQRAQSA
ncbi:MAG: hypothetical protein ABJ356_10760 [Balneola sp.]